jgi:oligoendopeptidase F
MLKDKKNEYEVGKWDLSSLAPNYKTQSFKKLMEKISHQVILFENKRSLLHNKIKEKDFYNIIRLYEEIIEETSKISDYAYLLFATDTSNTEYRSLYTKIEAWKAKIVNRILFFSLWWKKTIDNTNANRLMRNTGELKHYLNRQRELAKFTLSEPEEKIINLKDTTGVGFLQRLYDQFTERFSFHLKIRGQRKELKKPELIALFKSPLSEERRGAYKLLFKVYGLNEDILGELYKNIVLDWKNEFVDIRGYRSPITVRNKLNNISDEAVSSLLKVCRKNNVVFQKYLKEKSRILKIKNMSRYHIYAPFDKSEQKYSFSEAINIVLSSLAEFSPKIASLAKRVLEEKHLDSELRKGKRGGAFCVTTSPKITPYILVNYTGREHDVFTLAHELGHAIHSELAKDKSILVQHAPLPLAELASVFSEMIVQEKIMGKVVDEERIRILASQIDEMYATILRQAYFTIFEIDAHNAVEEGITVEELSERYLLNLKEQFGSAVIINDCFKYEWTYIPHFYHSPFYTYSYSFGNLLTVSLYKKYLDDGKKFVEKYIKLLSAGGSEKPELLLKKAGIDVKSETFWQSGFNLIDKRINEIKKYN